MKRSVSYARELRRRWIFIICDWLANLIPSLISIFMVMFSFVLFGVWYFPGLNWWLVAADIVLIACMVAVTVVFAIGSQEISLKIKPARETKTKIVASH